MDSEGSPPFPLVSRFEVLNVEEQNVALTFSEEIESHENLKPPISHQNVKANQHHRQPASQVSNDEIKFYGEIFPGDPNVNDLRINCTACDRQLDCDPNNFHPVLQVLFCGDCKRLYGSGTFPRDVDGSETFCRLCARECTQMLCCSFCPNVFCTKCILRNLGVKCLKKIARSDDWACFVCDIRPLWQQRALYHAIIFLDIRKQSLDIFPRKKTSSINKKNSILVVDLTLDDEEEAPVKKYGLPNVNKDVVKENKQERKKNKDRKIPNIIKNSRK